MASHSRVQYPEVLVLVAFVNSPGADSFTTMKDISRKQSLIWPGEGCGGHRLGNLSITACSGF